MTAHERTQVLTEAHPALDMRRVSFRHGRGMGPSGAGGEPWAVRDLDVAVGCGEMLGVIGPNGSGKSSLLKLLAGLVRPQRGTIHLFGSDLQSQTRLSLARQMAYMPQDVSFDFPFSVMDMVLMGRYPYRSGGGWSLLGWERRDDVAIAHEAMAMTDVQALSDRLVGTLSAGERQRVLLARALAQQPRVLLLDEPTAHLDLNHQLEVCRILTRVHAQLGMTVILVSHDINLASQYCDRIAIMREGHLVSVGSPHEVVHARRLAEIYGCDVLVDAHPHSGRPRVTMPGAQGM